VRVNDHDFRSDAIGVAIPYGIYDLLANRGSVFVGVSHDTAAFAATPSPTGGSATARTATAAAGICSSWPILAAVTVAVPAPGKRNCKANSATALDSQNRCSLPHGRFQMESHRAPPCSPKFSKNWAAEPLDSYPKVLNFIRNTCTRTGLAVSPTSTEGSNLPASTLSPPWPSFMDSRPAYKRALCRRCRQDDGGFSSHRETLPNGWLNYRGTDWLLRRVSDCRWWIGRIGRQYKGTGGDQLRAISSLDQVA